MHLGTSSRRDAPRVKESALQSDLIFRVRLLGGVALKLAPTVKGMPDLLVILPGLPPALVELKTERGRLSVAQRSIHARLEAIGTPVHVLYGVEQIKEWLRTRYDSLDAQRRKPRAGRRK